MKLPCGFGLAHYSDLDITVGDPGKMSAGTPLLSTCKVLQQIESKECTIETRESFHQIDLAQGIGNKESSDKQEEHSETRIRSNAAQASVDEGFHSPKSGLWFGLLLQGRNEAGDGLQAQLSIWNGGFSGGLEQQGQSSRADTPEKMRHPGHHGLASQNDGHPLIVANEFDLLKFKLLRRNVLVGQQEVCVRDPTVVLGVLLPRSCELGWHPTLYRLTYKITRDE